MIFIVFHDELINTSHQFDDEKFEIIDERSYYVQNPTVSFLITIKKHMSRLNYFLQIPKFFFDDDNIYVFVPKSILRESFKIIDVKITSTRVMYKFNNTDDFLMNDETLFDEIKLTQPKN